MTRSDLCAGGDGRITFVRQGRWDDEVWVHEDGTRFRDGHVAQPAPQCPKCGSPKYVTEKTDPWTVRCMECGHEEEAMAEATVEERAAGVLEAFVIGRLKRAEQAASIAQSLRWQGYLVGGEAHTDTRDRVAATLQCQMEWPTAEKAAAALDEAGLLAVERSF